MPRLRESTTPDWEIEPHAPALGAQHRTGGSNPMPRLWDSTTPDWGIEPHAPALGEHNAGLGDRTPCPGSD